MQTSTVMGARQIRTYIGTQLALNHPHVLFTPDETANAYAVPRAAMFSKVAPGRWVPAPRPAGYYVLPRARLAALGLSAACPVVLHQNALYVLVQCGVSTGQCATRVENGCFKFVPAYAK